MKIFTWKIAATPRRRKGPPRSRGPLRRRQLRLDELGDSGGGHSSLPRRSVARLGEPLYLGRGGLSLGVPTMVRGLCCSLFRVGLMAQFVIIMACFRGHCVTCLDVNVCVLTC